MDQLYHFLNLDTFRAADLLVVVALIVLEGMLSCDNAVALAIVVRRLPREQQGRALRYGLVSAYLFLILALLAASWIIGQWYLKLAGGAYLLWVGIAHLRKGLPSSGNSDAPPPAPPRWFGLSPFWSTVILVELTDMAFSVDSIAAAVGLSSKLWVLILGSMLAVLTMRFAAQGFIVLLRRFPRLETSAFIAVATIGLKLVLEFPLDVIGFGQPLPPAGPGDDQPHTELSGSRAWIEIPHILTINASALPEPDPKRFRNDDDYRKSRRLWNLQGRSFIKIDEIPSSLLLVVIFAGGLVRWRRSAPAKPPG